MANVIAGHISGQYGGPRSCDTNYGGTAATFCVTNAGDCSHTKVVGLKPDTSVYYTDSDFITYSDNIKILQGAPYEGPLSCTSDYCFYYDECNYCASNPCNDAEAWVPGSFYVNPGQCVELKFTVYYRLNNSIINGCGRILTLTIQGATAPNLGVLTGEWYASFGAGCCYQTDENKLCAPAPFGLSHFAYLTGKMFYEENMDYQSDTSTFCCPANSSDCPDGTPTVSAITGGTAGSDCIASYFRYCEFSGGEPGCFEGPDPAHDSVAPPIAGPKYATYLYCSDQPCGAWINFYPNVYSGGGTAPMPQPIADSYIFLDITGYPGCGVGCTAA